MIPTNSHSSLITNAYTTHIDIVITKLTIKNVISFELLSIYYINLSKNFKICLLLKCSFSSSYSLLVPQYFPFLKYLLCIIELHFIKPFGSCILLSIPFQQLEKSSSNLVSISTQKSRKSSSSFCLFCIISCTQSSTNPRW